MIVASFGIVLGLIALIVPGVLLALGWAVVAQVAAIEHEGWLPSLHRSRALTRGHYWHIFALRRRDRAAGRRASSWPSR